MFTIKGGGEVFTRLLGGVSYQVGEIGGDAIGFQPLAHADEPNERIELHGWVLDLLRAQERGNYDGDRSRDHCRSGRYRG